MKKANIMHIKVDAKQGSALEKTVLQIISETRKNAERVKKEFKTRIDKQVKKIERGV